MDKRTIEPLYRRLLANYNKVYSTNLKRNHQWMDNRRTHYMKEKQRLLKNGGKRTLNSLDNDLRTNHADMSDENEDYNESPFYKHKRALF